MAQILDPIERQRNNEIVDTSGDPGGRQADGLRASTPTT